MRISDWSSDVCSSDLLSAQAVRSRARWRRGRLWHLWQSRHGRHHVAHAVPRSGDGPDSWPASGLQRAGRSEEHTSDLQSLMRISYAVFCLKQKTKTNIILDFLLQHTRAD